MIKLRRKPLPARLLVHAAFGLALLALAARVIQLARAPAADTAIAPTAPAGTRGSGSAGGSIGAAQAVSAPSVNVQLSELYAHCPMAATIDLETVATSPEKVDALLPPIRPTADHVAIESAGVPLLPTVRYPVPLRVASLPKVAAATWAAAATPPAAKNDWLIDPDHWYTPEERAARPRVPAPARPPNENITPVPDGSSAPIAPTAPAGTGQPASPDAGSAGGFDGVESSTGQHSAPLFEPPADPLPRVPAGADSPNPTERVPVFAPPASEAAAPAQSAPPEETLPVTPPATDLFPPPGPTGGGDAPARNPHGPSKAAPRIVPGVDPHLELFAKSNYPSARECATCHEDIYHEWSISAHAYAAVSPMFHKFEQKLNDLSQGTVGYFCMRCHAPVATALCESRAEPIWNMPEVAREGITCIACHRVQYIYGKSNGERRIEPGDVFAPVMGGIGGEGVAEVVARKDEFKVKTSPEQQGPGQDMHLAGIYFEPLTKSEFCTPCHQVAVHPGIKLEVVWEQYRASPACKKGIQCQDCHMGRVPGLPLGYNCGPVAKVADKTVNDQRKKSNHVFYGPNYSIAHPGIFPFHLKANRWTIDQWLLFDWRAGWGTGEFERQVDAGQIQPVFPPVWAEADDRYDAREIIEENLKKLNHKRDLRIEVMENGSHVEGPFFDSARSRGDDLRFHFLITNTNEGHNLLTASLGAQPQLWANIVLIGPDGRRLWETGYTDSFGDVANIHSHDVRHKKIPYDWQLFNLQSMFLITGAKGTDREFYVPVNVDIDQLPFIRPGTQPISVINHPPFIRMESQSLAPLGTRKVPYRIPGELLCQPGTYRMSFRMRSRAEPIYFMQFCGATDDMQRSMNEWMIDIHPMSIEFTIE